MSISLRASPIFWQGLRALLTDTKLTALQYNKLVYLATESSSELPEISTEKLQYTLLGSPLLVTHQPLFYWLKKVTEKMLSDGQLTGSQRALATVSLQKMETLDLPSQVEVQ